MAVLSTISPRLRISAYRSVVGLVPDVPCAPCYAIEDDQCPIGHPECTALRTPNVSPKVILKIVEQLVIENLNAENSQGQAAGSTTRSL